MYLNLQNLMASDYCFGQCRPEGKARETRPIPCPGHQHLLLFPQWALACPSLNLPIPVFLFLPGSGHSRQQQRESVGGYKAAKSEAEDRGYIRRQMSRPLSRGSAGEYQADERAGVEWLSWRVSGR